MSILKAADLDLDNIPPRERRRRCYVAQDYTEVQVLGEGLAEVWWRGRQWAVTAYGLEALDGRYAIEASRLVAMADARAHRPQDLGGRGRSPHRVDGRAHLHGVPLPSERVRDIIAACPPSRTAVAADSGAL
jgi:hypothetical protein